MKLDLTEFNGDSDPENLLEWIRQIEKVSEYKGYNDHKRYKLATIKLTKYASLWLEGFKAQRRRYGKEPIDTWSSLKKKLKAMFPPREYKQEQYIKLTSLMQDNLSVAEYTRESDRLCLICDMQEKEALKIARYSKGLSRHIENQVDIAHYITFDDVCKRALKFESRGKEQQKPNFSGGYKAGSNSSYKGNSFQNTYKTTSFMYGGGRKGSSSQTKELRT